MEDEVLDMLTEMFTIKNELGRLANDRAKYDEGNNIDLVAVTLEDSAKLYERYDFLMGEARALALKIGRERIEIIVKIAWRQANLDLWTF